MLCEVPLTKEQQEFAAEHHGLVYKFLNDNHLPEDEFYDVVIFPYLKAVRDYCDSTSAQEYSFSTIAITRRVPAIIRLDGKAFHTFTKGMEKPFDPVLTQAMQETMKYLCENIQGCVLGYTQSDEITLVLTDYATIQTDAWFGYNIQKMCSVSASMATMAFNREFERIAEDWFHDNGPYWKSIGVDVDVDLTIYKRYNAYQKKMFTAMFDSRVFSVPKEEVCNCLIWRQQDATRNSIEAVGQANFSHHELHKKTCNMIQEMLWSQRGINWNDFPTELKRGSCCIKRRFEETIDDPRNPGQKITVCRNRWIIDHEIPIFTQDREYLERLI